MAILDDAKQRMRISAGNSTFDDELNDLIAEAQDDLKLSGVTAAKADDPTDSLIKRAIITYVKANFGWDNPDAERLQASYEMIRSHLCLSAEYSGFAVTFTVTDSSSNPLEDATVTLDDEEKITDSNGQVVYTGVRTEQNIEYSVTLDRYIGVEDEVDVTADTTVSVTLEAE